jgi:predicted dehydrogenase
MWLSGDHIVEQHVHNIDVANWVLGKLPETAYGVGGLQVRNPDQPTQIYDHHAVTFTYPGGIRVFSECRQFPGGENRVEEEFLGTKGIVKTRSGFAEITDHDGKSIWKYDAKGPNPYQVEHDELQDAIRNDKPLNDAWHGATSSFSAVLGRYATYSGKQVRYDKVLAFDDRTMPENLTWDSPAPVMPEKDGSYPIPMPATYKFPAAKNESA